MNMKPLNGSWQEQSAMEAAYNQKRDRTTCPHGHPLDDPNAEPCYRKGCYDPPAIKKSARR